MQNKRETSAGKQNLETGCGKAKGADVCTLAHKQWAAQYHMGTQATLKPGRVTTNGRWALTEALSPSCGAPAYQEWSCSTDVSGWQSPDGRTMHQGPTRDACYET